MLAETRKEDSHARMTSAQAHMLATERWANQVCTNHVGHELRHPRVHPAAMHGIEIAKHFVGLLRSLRSTFFLGHVGR